MKSLLLLASLAMLAGCNLLPRKPMPVDEGCDALCRTPCDASIPLWTPADPDAADAWDTYPEQVTIPLRGKVQTCDLHRQSCVQCLDRLKAAGVTR